MLVFMNVLDLVEEVCTCRVVVGTGQGVGWRQGDLLVEQAELEGHVNGVK